MSERPSDHIPTQGFRPPRSKRGGARPGAGARPGNLNALKHGRYSRFRDHLISPVLDPLAVAGRHLSRDRQEAERIAASFLRVLLDTRYQRDVAEAVAARLPLPPAPVRPASWRDLQRVARFLRNATAEARLARAAEHGDIHPDNRALQQARARAQQIEAILPAIAAMLDRAAGSALTPTALAALLANGQEDVQTPDTFIELGPAVLRALAESTTTPASKTNRSNLPTNSRHTPGKKRIVEATSPLPRTVGEGPGEGAAP